MIFLVLLPPSGILSATCVLKRAGVRVFDMMCVCGDVCAVFVLSLADLNVTFSQFRY